MPVRPSATRRSVHPSVVAALAPILLCALLAGCGSKAPSTSPLARSNRTPGISPSQVAEDPNAWRRLDSIQQPEGFMKILVDANGKRTVTCAPCHPPVDTVMTDIATGPGGLVAVGWIIQGFHGAVWRSADGTSWTLDNSFPETTLLQSVASNGRRYVAAGRNGPGSTVWTSSDGSRWQESSSAAFAATPLRIQSVISWRGRFVAAGFEGAEYGSATAAFWHSDDGLSWTRVASVPGSSDARATSVAGGPNGLVALGITGPPDHPGPAAVWTSPDGISWTRLPDDPTFHDARLRSITYASAVGYVAVGENLAGNAGAVLVSSDGTHWRRAPASVGLGRPDIQLRMEDVVAGGPGVVAVGNETVGVQYGEATIWTSPDGLAWTLQPISVSLLDGELNAVSTWGSRLVGVGDRGAPDTYVAQVWASPSGWAR